MVQPKPMVQTGSTPPESPWAPQPVFIAGGGGDISPDAIIVEVDGNPMTLTAWVNAVMSNITALTPLQPPTADGDYVLRVTESGDVLWADAPTP